MSVLGFVPSEGSALESIDTDNLVHQSVAVGGECFSVVGECQHPGGEFRWVVVAACACACHSPVVAGIEPVLAFPAFPVDADHWVVVGWVEGVGQLVRSFTKREDRAFVFRLVHADSQSERSW